MVIFAAQEYIFETRCKYIVLSPKILTAYAHRLRGEASVMAKCVATAASESGGRVESSGR